MKILKKYSRIFALDLSLKINYEFTEKSALENIQKAKEKVYSYGTFRESDYFGGYDKSSVYVGT